MKTCLYSITYSGTWFKGGLNLHQIIDRAKQFGFDGIEIDLKRPLGSPLDLDAEQCAAIKEYAQSQGIEIAATAGNNNFSSPVVESIENELLMLKEQIRVTKALGAPMLRVFAAWKGVTMRDGVANYDIASRYFTFMDSTTEETYDRVKACLKEGIKWAEEAGVILVLQNHPPVIDDYEVMLNIVKQIDSPYLKCCLDAPNMEPYVEDGVYLSKAVHKVGDLQYHTHVSGEFEANEFGEPVMLEWDPIAQFKNTRIHVSNYPAFVHALKEIGYKGYISYEFCHAPRKNGQNMGLAYLDEQVAFASRYFKNLIENA